MSENEVEAKKRKCEDNNDDEEEEAVTMIDVLKDEEELEEDAKRVLGGADDKNCTYLSEGYAKRQALYACVTCCVPSSPEFDPAGICLACSYHCHEGHDLIELYTKRNFKCDCGNSKMKERKCKLYEKKEDLNTLNKYNQNFKGSYCTCGRPYPDPEETIPDEMIQCAVCEDWYHGRHLNLQGSLPANGDYDDMICLQCCTSDFDRFWIMYRGLSISNIDKKEEETVDVEKPPECPRLKKQESAKPTSLFLKPGWRNELCRCEGCLDLLRTAKLEFLLDPEDTIAFYESKGLEKKSASSYEEGLKALSEMDRTKQVEAISSYNSMKADLMDYLKTFAQNGRVVKPDDIQAFFQKIKSKKQKIEIPKFCK